MQKLNAVFYVSKAVLRFNLIRPELFKHTLVGCSCPKRTFVTEPTSASKDSKKYDIIITGGGMVGTAMAAALGTEECFKDKRILLLESAEQKTFVLPPVYCNRVVAISPATVKLLQSVGAWEFVTSHRYQPVKRMQVWDACSESAITFQRPDMTENLAYIVENDLVQAAFAASLNGVDVRYSTSVSAYKFEDDCVQLELGSGEILKTLLVIGADGFQSLLRKTACLHTLQWDYEQLALVAVLELSEDSENNVAWQRFLKTGPIAMLPLSSKFSCLIWTTTPDNAKTLFALAADNFVDAVNNAFWEETSKDGLSVTANQIYENLLSTLGVGCRDTLQLPPTIIDIVENSRASFPLGFVHSSAYVGRRFALIGDAAHRIHPLAGQGVNLGFGDVRCLKEQLVKAQFNGAEIGDDLYLQKYQSIRQRQVLPTMAAIDGLNRLYSTALTPLVALRSLGLQTTNAIGPLKEQIMKYAMD